MKPVLVLQMQRMGDIILSFPLLGILQKVYSDHPIWTVAEPTFFSELIKFSPKTTFFPPDAAQKLQEVDFHAVINLSHREDAARLAGSLKAEHYYGAHSTNTHSSIGGSWALYRASIVHNNRYNLFHWSDLQILDFQNAQNLRHEVTAKQEHEKAKIGIFVGASEQEKRPTPEFFAKLAQALLRKHYQPIFLGGPNDVEIGNEAMRISGIKHSSLCGKLSITQLARVLQELSLFITPDTGPMHLASWLKTPILNISIGPVNPWETGPIFPNNYILQPKISCSGCWQACKHTPCQQKLNVAKVALIAQTIVENANKISKLEIEDMLVYETNRDEKGLYNLNPLNNVSKNPRLLLSRFWQDWFYHSLTHEAMPDTSIKKLHIKHPYLIEGLQKGIISLGREFQMHLKNVYKGKEYELSHDFWLKLPKPMRPFTGYIHMFLQNKNYSKHAWDEVLQTIYALSKTLN